ncbi:MAG: flagellar brake protein [Paraburkholderia sp.]|uniref:flagellar brake protein n=1 Tax=Paraburkholderia sp. TaxID=1926495 RepID=UPI0011FC3FAF|nr:flagellar brake protein [Paraburkholderia sp.]TAM05223.1 MAG: flagellar brake protein [Paraburkholderia sp.]TAM28538.1 MAG: flagellar brake protein [Paraburkholderia sp.]
MNTVQSNQQEEVGGEEDVPEFARRNPLEVGVQLRNLVNRGDFLTLQYRGGQIVTRILDVDTRNRTFVFDWGALAEQNTGVLNADQCEFHASPEGVRVQFTTRTPQRTDYEGRPAFVASFPEVLYYIQRREYFRVDTPVMDPCICRGVLPDDSPFTFVVHDISLGGVGLRTTDPRAEAIGMGVHIPDVELDLRANGKLRVDLALVVRRFIDLPNGERRYHLGFRFELLPGSTENSLQRYITQLEMKRRSLARA